MRLDSIFYIMNFDENTTIEEVEAHLNALRHNLHPLQFARHVCAVFKHIRRTENARKKTN